MKWYEVKIKTTTEAIEAVSNILYDAGVTGVAIEDPNDPIFTSKEEGDWDYFDESILNFEFEGAIVKGYLPESDNLIDLIETIKVSIKALEKHNIDTGLGELITTEIFEEDWANEWKKYYKPRHVTDSIVIKPTWEEYEAKEGDLVIEMDPGGAFGTGTHETTMMCIQALEGHVKQDTTVYDIGCGSGILAVAAAKLGAKEVYAVDLDEAAVEASLSNVSINHVEDKVTVLHGNLMDLLKEPADVVVANIIADVIIFLSKTIHRFMHEESVFIASGIIIDKKDEVLEALEKNGLEILHVEVQGEWVAITSKRKVFDL